MEGVLSTRTKHAAPGQYLGFAIQPVRLCYHLLACPAKARVSIELLDDIAIHYADGSVLLEQAKSALSQNPLSDWAVDLWKCIANWFAAIGSGAVASGTSRFRLYVTPVRSGDLSNALSEAQTGAQIEALAVKIRSRLARMKKPPLSLPFIETFIDATPADRFGLISQFSVISYDADPVDPIRALLSPTVDPSLVDPLCTSAIGRAKEAADRLIRSGAPAILDGDSFKREFRNFVQKNNLPGFLTSLTSPPPEGEVSALLATRPIFVKQLELIEVTDDERFRAVSDFLRAAADRSSWADAGLIFRDELKEWNSELKRRHGLINGEVSDVHAEKPPATRGRIVYRQCAQMQPQLEGRPVAGHFVHGCLNDLADSRTIGWHPDYVGLLKGEIE